MFQTYPICPRAIIIIILLILLLLLLLPAQGLGPDKRLTQSEKQGNDQAVTIPSGISCSSLKPRQRGGFRGSEKVGCYCC